MSIPRRTTLVPVVVLVAAIAALLPRPAQAGGPTMALGVAEDAVKAPTLIAATAEMNLIRALGLSTVRITSQWTPGLVAPTPGELATLRSVDGAARLTGMRVVTSVYHPGSRTTPLTPEARAELAQYAAALVAALPAFDDIVIGNEPNLNRFWLPQFNPDGSIASAPAYLALLAQAYDAIKAVDPAVRVWGGATSSRGADRPDGVRPTTSPTAFIRSLGVAYRASGRTLPIMDGWVQHPYLDTSSQSPSTQHPLGTTVSLADYGKLVKLLGEAFDGTPQVGTTLPILYAEFGIESTIPAGKASLYTGTEPTTTKPVDERTQAARYAEALGIAFCQPTVVGMLIFHSRDETELGAWQSGAYYADGTPKASVYGLRDAVRLLRGGSIARCSGQPLQVALSAVRFPPQTAFAKGDRIVRFRCSLDCSWQVRAVDPATDGQTAAVRGFRRAGESVVASLKGRRLGGGPVRLEIVAVQPVNPGTPTTRRSAQLTPP